MATISSAYKIKVGGGLQLPRTYRKKIVEFGEGYKQRNSDGINVEQRKFSITFTDLSSAEKDALMAIITGAKEVDAIDWQAPDDNVERKWLVTRPTITWHNGVFWEITCEFELLNEN